jgi:hypothetical protein
VNQILSRAPQLKKGTLPLRPEGGNTVRLTLRTLLAYLDDTLEPIEIKTIGKKVAESNAAQVLIARIKQVTRRKAKPSLDRVDVGSYFLPSSGRGRW